MCLVLLALESKERAYVGRAVKDRVKESCWRLVKDIISDYGLESEVVVGSEAITFPRTGSTIGYMGLRDISAESIKSLQGCTIFWVDEAQELGEPVLEALVPTLRAESSEFWASMNPTRPTDAVWQRFVKGEPRDDQLVQWVQYYDNPWFPDVLERERVWFEEARPDRYAHVWLGQLEPTTVGALWTLQAVRDHRITAGQLPEMEQVVVAVDPAVSDKGEGISDEHGIAVCGLGVDGRGYLLGDSSLRGRPAEWARQAVAAFDQWEADQVVVEVNQGGDMCVETLRTARPMLPVVEVRATKGKHVRAAPIAAAYETGRVSHAGHFPELEEQLMQFNANGYQGSGSPDRAEAAIWGFTHLLPAMRRPWESDEGDDRPTGDDIWMA